MTHTLFPCSVTINYKSENAPHKMTLPLTPWSPVSGGHISGTNTDYTDTQVDTDDWIQAFILLIAPFFAATTTFVNYTLYTYADVNAPARPQVSQSIGVVGTNGGAIIPATQATFNFKTAGFFPFKLVFLDTQVSAVFLPKVALVSPADDDEIAIRDYILDDNAIVGGRDNTRVANLVKITYTLNERLRASYNID